MFKVFKVKGYGQLSIYMIFEERDYNVSFSVFMFIINRLMFCVLFYNSLLREDYVVGIL